MLWCQNLQFQTINYSNYVITEAMSDILGLKYSIKLPPKHQEILNI